MKKRRYRYINNEDYKYNIILKHRILLFYKYLIQEICYNTYIISFLALKKLIRRNNSLQDN